MRLDYCFRFLDMLMCCACCAVVMFVVFVPCAIMNIIIFTVITHYVVGLNRSMHCACCAVVIFMTYLTLCLNEHNDFNNNTFLNFRFLVWCSVLVVQLRSSLFTYCCAVINEVILIILFYVYPRFLNSSIFCACFQLGSPLFIHSTVINVRILVTLSLLYYFFKDVDAVWLLCSCSLPCLHTVVLWWT